MDRTVATGTAFIGQYPPEIQELYETMERCPDNLLLFFHHVPYTHVLHSGKTVIQHIYDSHYEGAERVRDFVAEWQTLKGHMDEERYADIYARLQYQAGESIVWRDAICKWIFLLSGIPDRKDRVGNHSSN
jgi:alpha-glucuronidase